MVEQSNMEQIAFAAAEEARDAMLKLGIKGSTATARVDVIARVKFKLPRKLYFLNSRRIMDTEIRMKDKYPDVKFDFDLEFIKG